MQTKTITSVKIITGWVLSLLLLFGVATPTLAAEGDTSPEVPLYAGLTWEPSFSQEQTVLTTDGEITLTGQQYIAPDAINLDSADSVSLVEYYTSKNLSEAGWQLSTKSLSSNGNIATYFHAQGYYLVVTFQACKADNQMACLSVWQSDQTDKLPANEESRDADIIPLATFGKSAPANGSTNINQASVTLSWAKYTGSDLDRYRYCIATTNHACTNSAGDWTNAWGSTSVTLTSLQGSQTYYWQVQAVLDDNSKVDADSGTWWSFSTIPTQPPAAFSKLLPANNAINQSITPILSWQSSATATSYEYCIDTTNDNLCGTSWVNAGTNTQATLSVGLTPSTNYYWQVRANNGNGSTIANSNSWWTFNTTPSLPPAAFSKLLPADTATNVSITPVLSWQASPYASSYEYCIDTANNSFCDTNWINISNNTYMALASGLTPNTTYYWQVRANNAIGTTSADGGTWRTFSTGTPLANDFLESATLVNTIPFAETLNTNAATIDMGTQNTCSPGLGYASVWYKYTPVANGKLYFDTILSNYDTFIAVWRQSSPSNIMVTCNDDLDATIKQSSINLTVTAGTTYYIQVAQKNNNTAPTQTPGGTLKVQARYFLDVLGNNPFASYIETLRQSGITSGCAVTPDRLYCPTNTVNRAQMAVFLLRGIYGASYVPPAATGTVFADVPVTHPQAAWIEKLSADGITTGCGGSNYCPDSTITRAQMAVFLLRSEHGSSYTPPAATGTMFADVPLTHPQAAWIEQLSNEGISTGCGAGNFCPAGTVNRGQMAVFLVRTFSLP